MKKITKLWKHFWEKPFFRFLFVGGINTLFGYGVYTVLILIGLDYKLAILISTTCGVLFNFKTTGVLVFRSRNNVLIFKFIGVYIIVYFANVLGVKLLLLTGLNSLAAGAICLLPVALLSFFLNKYFVFKKA